MGTLKKWNAGKTARCWPALTTLSLLQGAGLCATAGWGVAGRQQSRADGLLLWPAQLLNPSHRPPRCQLAPVCMTPLLFKVLGSETFQHPPSASLQLAVWGWLVSRYPPRDLLVEDGWVLGQATEAVPMLRVSLYWFLKVTMEICGSNLF